VEQCSFEFCSSAPVDSYTWSVAAMPLHTIIPSQFLNPQFKFPFYYWFKLDKTVDAVRHFVSLFETLSDNSYAQLSLHFCRHFVSMLGSVFLIIVSCVLFSGNCPTKSFFLTCLSLYLIGWSVHIFLPSTVAEQLNSHRLFVFPQTCLSVNFHYCLCR